jgi:hypothetical protein
MSLDISKDGLRAAVGCPHEGSSAKGVVHILQLPSFGEVCNKAVSSAYIYVLYLYRKLP